MKTNHISQNSLGLVKTRKKTRNKKLNNSGNVTILFIGTLIFMSTLFLSAGMSNSELLGNVLMKSKIQSTRNLIAEKISRYASFPSSFRQSLDPLLKGYDNTALNRCLLGDGSGVNPVCQGDGINELPIRLVSFSPSAGTAPTLIIGTGKPKTTTYQPAYYDINGDPCDPQSAKTSGFGCPFEVSGALVPYCTGVDMTHTSAGKTCATANSFQIKYHIEFNMVSNSSTDDFQMQLKAFDGISDVVTRTQILPPLAGAAAVLNKVATLSTGPSTSGSSSSGLSPIDQAVYDAKYVKKEYAEIIKKAGFTDVTEVRDMAKYLWETLSWDTDLVAFETIVKVWKKDAKIGKAIAASTGYDKDTSQDIISDLDKVATSAKNQKDMMALVNGRITDPGKAGEFLSDYRTVESISQTSDSVINATIAYERILDPKSIKHFTDILVAGKVTKKTVGSAVIKSGVSDPGLITIFDTLGVHDSSLMTKISKAGITESSLIEGLSTSDAISTEEEMRELLKSVKTLNLTNPTRLKMAAQKGLTTVEKITQMIVKADADDEAYRKGQAATNNTVTHSASNTSTVSQGSGVVNGSNAVLNSLTKMVRSCSQSGRSGRSHGRFNGRSSHCISLDF